MQDSVFTKIIKGQIPCHKVYEDDKVLAMVDIHPIQPGMVVVVPKVQVNHFFDLEEADYLALMQAVKRVAKRMKQAYSDKARIGVIIEGFEAPHAHVKLFPIDSGDELRAMPEETTMLGDEAQAAVAAKLGV